MFKKWFTILIAVLALGTVLAACQAEPEVVEVTREVITTETITETIEVEVGGTPTTVEVTRVVEVEREVEVPVEATRPPVDRRGAWLDTVVIVEEPSADAAVNRLQVGDIDIYAFQVTNPQVARNVEAAAELEFERSFGSYSELSFNPVGPVFENGNLNPFAVPRVREAMNWLIDRDFIAQELHGGLAVPRWHAFNNASNDYALLADVARSLELRYAYDRDRAEAVITEEMEALGASLVGGQWQYEGAPVEIILLIRNEDERLQIGDYIANQLEDIGFATVRDYRTAGEASPVWIQGDPALGLFHIYTGGWITTAVPRDLGGNFAFFYTDMGLASPLWQAYENDPEFYDLAERLDNNDFRTLEERREMLARAMELALEDSLRIWLIDRSSITPRRAEVSVAADLYGGISGSSLWQYTLRRGDEVGGSMRIAMPSILTAPWNPLDGSNWIYDTMLYRSTGEFATNSDPFTGLPLPQRIERAEVFVEEGLPVGATHDWVTLEFVSGIDVPEDAWVDWDAAEQRFITAGEAYPEGRTALSRNVVYYPADLYDTVMWHDGSPFTIGDIVMAMILQFDRAKEESEVHDPAIVASFNSFMSGFRGVRILSEDPLVIETYRDNYALDAEQNINTWWPYYARGMGAWHSLAIGLLADAEGSATFGNAKATRLEVEHLSYIAGPTLEILADKLTEAADDGYLPYAATLSEYVSSDEISSRYRNLQEWRRSRGHFWIGTGVFYLERAFPVEGTIILQRNPNYPDPADKWDRFASPAIAEVELDGPGRVSIGGEATYDVWVTFEGEDYAVDDISQVTFMVFDATGELAHVGLAEAVEDGLWQIVLTPEITRGLEAGSNLLEVVVVSRRVALPSTDSLTFVTAQ